MKGKIKKMNRSERRRKERRIKKNTGLSSEQIRSMKKEATNAAFDVVFSCLFTLPFEILNKNYGFGKKRLQKFNDELTTLLKDVESEKVDLAELSERIKKDFGIIYRNGED